MAAAGGTNIVREGLSLIIDPSNTRSTSFERDHNLLDYNTWTVNGTSATGFNRNGSAEENLIIYGTGPFGEDALLWQASPDATSGADGGWNGSNFAIDNTKLYRFSVWVKRSSNSNGRFYFGCNGFGSVNGVLRRYDTTISATTNPYFWTDITSFTTDTWYLVVGHVWPVGSGTGDEHPNSGRYTIENGRVGNISTDFVWIEETTSTRHRSYLYYGTDTAQRQYWVYPRVDLVDGTEPSIEDLLGGNTRDLKDLTGSSRRFFLSNNSKIRTNSNLNGPAKKTIHLDGSNEFLDLGEDITISPDNQGWSAEYWFYTNNASALQHFNSAESDTFNANWLAIYNSKLAVWNVSPGYWKYGDTVIQNNTWYQATFVCDVGGTNYRYYINGVREGGDHVDNTWTAQYSSFEVRYIGRYEYSNSYSRYFDGEIGLVKFYNRPLSSQEVNLNFQGLRTRFAI